MKICDSLRANSISNKRHKDVIIVGNGPSAITLSYILAGNHPFYLGEQSENKLSNEELHCRLIEADESELCHFKQTIQKTRCKNKSKCFCKNFSNSDSESFDSQINDFEADQNEIDFVQNELANFSLDNKLINDQIVSKSLIERNLEYLSSGLVGRSFNPVSIFLDELEHPDADLGEKKPSLLKWVHSENKVIDHLVIGKALPGGAWQKMHDCKETLTISLGAWMQLPDYTIEEWSKTRKNSDLVSNNRVALSCVADYYQDYVHKKNLEKYFLNNCEVKKVTFCEKLNVWLVYCKNELTKEKYFYTANHLVLATGISDKPNKLNVVGENLWFVKHYLNDLEVLIKENKLNNENDCILIIGAGLSAADAIIASLQNNIKVIHVFRKHPDDAGLIFNQLPPSVYPEYLEVYQLMKGELKDENYKAFPMHCVGQIKANKEVILYNKLSSDNDDNVPLTKKVKVSYVLSLIGNKPNLKFISSRKLRKSLPHRPNLPLHYKTNPVKINLYTHEVVRIKRLYALGMMVGDNFIRYMQGGALAIASHLHRQIKDEN